MTLHHVVEIVVACAVGLVKLVGTLVGDLLGELVSEGLFELVKAPFRRKDRRRALTGLEREADERRREFWAEALSAASSRTRDRAEPDPHVLTLRKRPTPPREAMTRSPAGPGGGAYRPPRRSTSG